MDNIENEECYKGILENCPLCISEYNSSDTSDDDLMLSLSENSGSDEDTENNEILLISSLKDIINSQDILIEQLKKEIEDLKKELEDKLLIMSFLMD